MVKRFTLTAAAVLFGLAAGSATAQDFTMKWSTPSIKDDEISIHWLPKTVLESEIETRSGGRIDVQLFAKGQLGKMEDMPGQVRAGIIQGADMADGPVAALFPDIQLLSIPYLFVNREVAWAVLDGPFGEAISEKMAETVGLRPLAFGEIGYRHFSTASTPVTKLEDLQGLKIRTMTNPVHIAMVNGLGASATPIAWSELYSALQTNVVDGQENPISNFIQVKLYEVQEHLVLDGHVYGAYLFLVSEKWFETLPDDMKAAVRQGAVVAAKTMRGLAVATEQRDTQTLREAGMEIHGLTAAEKRRFQEAAQAATMPMIEKDADPALLALLKDEVAKAEAKFGYR